MKRIILLAVLLGLMLGSIGGCWPWWYEDGRGGRGGGGERGGGHGRGGGGHEERR